MRSSMEGAHVNSGAAAWPDPSDFNGTAAWGGLVHPPTRTVTRLYRNKEHAEVEYTIGPIPIDDDVGKEVITRLTASMITNSTFYTDSNGRDFLKREPF
nr:unnamed protein product [Digitaria exilis]